MRVDGCLYGQVLNGTSLVDFACVFWDFTLDDWSTAGCSKGGSSDGVLRCSCNHTTNFAALWVSGSTRRFPTQSGSGD